MFENISKKIANVSKGAVNGTKKFAESVSLSTQIDDCRKEIRQCYTQLGETYYKRTKSGTIPEEFEGIFERIGMLDSKIIQLQEQMKRVKGLRNCPKCGAEVADEAIFCPGCGFSLPPKVTPIPQPALQQKRCENCGSMVDEDAAFCTECGWSFTNQPQVDTSYMTEDDDEATVLLNDCQDTAANESVSEQILPDEVENIRVCKNCGAPLRPQSMFCTNCGTRADVM